MLLIFVDCKCVARKKINVVVKLQSDVQILQECTMTTTMTMIMMMIIKITIIISHSVW